MAAEGHTEASHNGRADGRKMAEEADSWQIERERERERERKRLVKKAVLFDESAPLVRKLQKEMEDPSGAP
jgi:hypothetical protein